ncbi:DUF3268 family zinc-finger domain-containing protein [Burkholderia multivorans]|uniref:DUF3268 family zinc-finger domain-containing protein n=1 Tax=Burkholderia multivorans TaxID=87883 RepID=UPI002158F3E9|nr:DUF3268 family zinc-finger domain-containing protein [Burkholderia multivorans]MDN7995948.1 DUF3268 family zinc-finger domain-containing protein [Burkholderia multivorans]
MQTTKTPRNPLRSATACVKNSLTARRHARTTAAPVDIVNNSAIYGREYGEWPWAFLCRSCRAYVGLHPFTAIPLGTLADGPTREARKRAKAAFNPIWQSGAMSRTDAYVWLARQLGIDNATSAGSTSRHAIESSISLRVDGFCDSTRLRKFRFLGWRFFSWLPIWHAESSRLLASKTVALRS